MDRGRTGAGEAGCGCLGGHCVVDVCGDVLSDMSLETRDAELINPLDGIDGRTGTSCRLINEMLALAAPGVLHDSLPVALQRRAVWPAEPRREGESGICFLYYLGIVGQSESFMCFYHFSYTFG